MLKTISGILDAIMVIIVIICLLAVLAADQLLGLYLSTGTKIRAGLSLPFVLIMSQGFRLVTQLVIDPGSPMDIPKVAIINLLPCAGAMWVIWNAFA